MEQDKVCVGGKGRCLTVGGPGSLALICMCVRWMLPERDLKCVRILLIGTDIPYNKTRDALQAWGFGYPTGRHSGRTKVSKSSGAGLLLLFTSSAPATSGQAGWGNIRNWIYAVVERCLDQRS